MTVILYRELAARAPSLMIIKICLKICNFVLNMKIINTTDYSRSCAGPVARHKGQMSNVIFM